MTARRADRVRVLMDVRLGDKVVRVDMTRPLNLGGDRRKHRTQLRAVAEEAISSAIAICAESADG